MADQEELAAQVVMKREDGRSILDSRGQTAQAAGALDVAPARAEEVRRALERHGFRVAGGNLNTLSVTGPAEAFERVFGLHARAREARTGAHATRIPEALQGYVADVFVPPPPDFFP